LLRVRPRVVISVNAAGTPWLRDRRYFSAEFAATMDEHARTELPLLRDHVAETRPTSFVEEGRPT
jgi:hypothetical protein